MYVTFKTKDRGNSVVFKYLSVDDVISSKVVTRDRPRNCNLVQCP